MRTLVKAALALGFVGAMFAGVLAVGSTAPANADGFYFNAPGIHIGIGGRWHRHYDGPRYYDYYPGPVGGGWDTFNGCPPNYTVQDGVCKPYRGY
jgi:hypothetical protein